MRFKFVIAGHIEAENEKEAKGDLGQMLGDAGIRSFAFKVEKDG